MKLKFIIDDRDKIKGFVCSIQMLSRHTDRLIFVVKAGKSKFARFQYNLINQK